MAVTNEQIVSFLQSNPGITDAQIAAAMQQYGVSPEQMSAVTGVPLEQVQSRIQAATAPQTTVPQTTAPGVEGLTLQRTGGRGVSTATQSIGDILAAAQTSAGRPLTDQDIAQLMQQRGITTQQMSQARYFAANLPAPLPAGTNTQSRIDPSLQPYLQLGLQRAQQLFLTGEGPQLFPGQMYVPPSEQTMSALSQQEALARGAQPTLQAAQEAYRSSLGQIGQTAAGGFLGGSPYREQLIQAATRPLTQQFESQVIPGISSLFSRAGRYGSGAMEQALGRATESYGRALGDVASTIAGQDYARERGLQQQAQLAQSALAQAAPSFFQASFLPAQALGQVGAAREAIAAQPLQEQIQRFQYGQQLPYQQLQGFLSSVYGTPMAGSQAVIPQTQTNRLGQAVGLGTLGYLGGQALQGQFGQYAPVAGAALGGLLGYGL
jgi:uncharacterized protein YneF (UPF0154 family)